MNDVGPVGPDGFRIRGDNVSRLEGISDAVFGLAFTLIVVSLKVPGSFDELVATLEGFVGSGVCAFLLLQIWNQHFLYFRRFGLEDVATRALNGFLLFVVIAYVYPLKFLFSLFFDSLLQVKAPQRQISIEDQPKLFVIYGVGFVMVYLIFAVMYFHALRKREDLEMSEMEALYTRWTILEHCLVASAGVLSILFAALGGQHVAVYAGFVYFVIPLFMTIHGIKLGDAKRQLETKLALVTAKAEAAEIPAGFRRDREIQIDLPLE
jgi:uncharacterized membrane protein